MPFVVIGQLVVCSVDTRQDGWDWRASLHPAHITVCGRLWSDIDCVVIEIIDMLIFHSPARGGFD